MCCLHEIFTVYPTLVPTFKSHELYFLKENQNGLVCLFVLDKSIIEPSDYKTHASFITERKATTGVFIFAVILNCQFSCIISLLI